MPSCTAHMPYTQRGVTADDVMIAVAKSGQSIAKRDRATTPSRWE